MTIQLPPLDSIRRQVEAAVAEDVGSGDVTAELIDARTQATAHVIAREAAVLCGCAWFDEVFRQVDPSVVVSWHATDGDALSAEQRLCTVRGPARALLTGERTALNFLQTLSGTATAARRYAESVSGTGTRILDTRKTIPGLRLAQKYAARCGGCHNHRIGLYDGILIKENHIAAAGSISAAVGRARAIGVGLLVEVEVESLVQLGEALDAGADRILLDNMGPDMLAEAVAITAGRAELEASGGLSLHDLRAVAQTGVDFISVGALTKHVQAVDLSMRFER
ncbi:MAG: nicotinate-nucleotide pyrophosphorylase [Gammaproteobacteria bacterium SG8_47]|nr:MAG: nicotinate-nucleotide pyrophosphorylase [Gammaproteobacteria bacterium SG8_47]